MPRSERRFPSQVASRAAVWVDFDVVNPLEADCLAPGREIGNLPGAVGFDGSQFRCVRFDPSVCFVRCDRLVVRVGDDMPGLGREEGGGG